MTNLNSVHFDVRVAYFESTHTCFIVTKLCIVNLAFYRYVLKNADV